MCDYSSQKVLRIPIGKLDPNSLVGRLVNIEDLEDSLGYCLAGCYPHLFNYATVGMFQVAPTEYPCYIDYVLGDGYDEYGEYVKTRSLYDSEKSKYFSEFQKIDLNINMDYVRLVEFCWHIGTYAPYYYDDEHDDFYDEV